MDQELDEFKRLDLRQYAAAQGYELDKRESSRGNAVMRRGGSGGDKIVIKRNTNGHYVYFSVRDDADNGTVIDFVQHRKKLSLGRVRQELRPWIGGKVQTTLPVFAPLPEVSKDLLAVAREYERMEITPAHPYLIAERGLPPALLASARFAGRIRSDERGNAVFPHFNDKGLCGFEKKNIGFTGFASGGEKGLWLSHSEDHDVCLVVCESAIDALSFAALFPDAQARYASIGGKPNPQQPKLLREEIALLPMEAEVIAAMDADDEGRKLTEVVRLAVVEAQRQDLRFTVQKPQGVKDWNDQLRTQTCSFPIAQIN